MNSYSKIALCLVCFVIVGYTQAEEDMVTSPNGVNFTHSSQLVGKDSGGRYDIDRFIKNNSQDYLCVDWPAGEIHCTGDHQLQPLGKASSAPGEKTTLTEPQDSIIRYGLKLQYMKKNAKVHVSWNDPANKNESFVTEFETDDSKGLPIYQVEVDAQVNQEENRCEITFKANRGLTILLPGRFARANHLVSTNEQWKILNVTKLSAILKGDADTIKSDTDWLTMETNDPFNPVELVNPSYSTSKTAATFFIAGTPNEKWMPVKVPILAFESGKAGAIGTVAVIYLQQKF